MSDREDTDERQSATGYGFDLGSRVRAREREDLRRDLSPTDRVAARARMAEDPHGDQPSLDGEDEQLIFGSNNYLGLAGDERIQDAAARAAREVGTGAGASRLITGDTLAHRRLERAIADAKHTERALVFSSGYAANVGTITALDPDVIFSDELNHASIIDACRLTRAETVIYDHCDPDSLAKAMELQAADAAGDERWLVVTDTVFSMDGDIAPLEQLCSVTEEYGGWLMVDEAHATGLYGDGGGIVGTRCLGDRVDIQLGTLSKALGNQGGYVAGDQPLVEHLLNAARSFVFSTGLSPPAAAAGREALRVASETDRPDRLWKNVESVRAGLEGMGYEVLGTSHILPVLVGDRQDVLVLDERLREAGIVAPAIRPPTVPEGTGRIRVAPMATHTQDEIDRFLSAFERAGSELGLI